MPKEPYECKKSEQHDIYTANKSPIKETFSRKMSPMNAKRAHERENSPIEEVESSDDAAKEPNECKKSPMNVERAL